MLKGTKFSSTEEALTEMMLKEKRDERLAKGEPFDEAEYRKHHSPALVSSIEEIGSTEPTYNDRPVVWVQDDENAEYFIPRETVFTDVARAVSALKEIDAYIVPSDISVRHSVTGKLLTEEWLFEYLAKAINFKHMHREEDDGKVPTWLPRMIVDYGKEFSAKMW
jgi:hypothetical protein